jgi:uncharacterized protein (DUF1684 family)
MTTETNADTEAYREGIERDREKKERFFADHPQSPVAGATSFAGLDHYPVDPAFRYVLPLHEHETKETVTVETTADGERKYVRFGEFRFTVDGTEVELQAYRPAGDEDRFWVPFRDETSGETTYGAGRYLDLDPNEHRTTDGEWVLDFNLAYNPTCAYNEAYECPLIPMENWLDVPIKAGERAYPGDPVSPRGHDHGD